MKAVTASAPNVEELTRLSNPIMFNDPFPRYAHLRSVAPVSYVKCQFFLGKGYLLTRYDDVMLVHTDKRFSSDPKKIGRNATVMKILPRILRLLTDSMVFKDDPDHKRLRSLVNMVFTQRMLTDMTEQIEQIVAGLLDDLASKREVDLVESFADPLPLAVIAKMLGVGDAESAKFHRWTKRFIEASGENPLRLLMALPTGQRMIRLFEQLVERGRSEPDDHLVSALVRARDEGEQLDEQELLAMIFLLLLAGHDTTANLIGSGVLALIENPDQLARLRAQPELIDTAVEELLRYTAPVACGTPRIALEDVEIAGVKIPKGSQILGMIISANRDESVFPNPDVLDLGRTPNRHLAFGFGSHFCVGNQLARAEARIAFRSLVQRFESIELAVPRGELRYKPSQSLRALRSLPVRLRERTVDASRS